MKTVAGGMRVGEPDRHCHCCAGGRRFILPLVIAFALSLPGCTATATANPGQTAPTPVAYLSLDDVSGEAKQDREQQFKGALTLTLSVNNVTKNGQIYRLDTVLSVTNQSTKPVVILRDWSTSDRGGPVFLRIKLKDLSLFYEFGISDRTRFDDSHSFLLIESGASRTFRTADAQVPATAASAVNLQKVDLSGKSLSITAVYNNWRVGYPIRESPLGRQVMFADMNAWIGQLESAPVQVTFP